MQRRTTSATGNRRVGQSSRGGRHFVLQVRARRTTAARARTRLVAKWFWLFLFWGTFATALAIGTQTALDKFFFANPDYQLAHVRLENCKVLTVDEARALSGIEIGENLFRVDLGVAEAALQRIPEVARARVRRELPDTIHIDLDVRQPVAWVGDVSGEEGHLIEASGFLYQPRVVLPEYSSLPLITGARISEVQSGSGLHREDVLQALELLQTARFSPECDLEIRSVDISKGWCLVVREAGGAEVVFEAENYGPQLARLQKLLDHCRETGRELEMVNLVPKRNTPVRFVLAEAPPTTEKPAKIKPR